MKSMQEIDTEIAALEAKNDSLGAEMDEAIIVLEAAREKCGHIEKTQMANLKKMHALLKQKLTLKK